MGGRGSGQACVHCGKVTNVRSEKQRHLYFEIINKMNNGQEAAITTVCDSV